MHGQRVTRDSREVREIDRVARTSYSSTTDHRSPLDGVILATPAFVSAEIDRGLSTEASALLAAIPYASTATVSVGLLAIPT